MVESEDCEPCKLDVAIGVINELCLEKNKGEVCQLKLDPLLNGEITLREYIKSVKPLLKRDRKSIKTIKEVTKIAREWNLLDEKVEVEYVEE